MTFWKHFFRSVLRRPKPALAALYWHLTRRKVRAHNRLRIASADLPFTYALWIRTIEKGSTPKDCDAVLKRWERHPRFSILLHAPGPYSEGQLNRSIASLEQQLYPSWTLVEGPPRPVCAGLASADGDYVIPLRVGDVLAPSALFRFAEALHGNGGAAILYGDQDELDERKGRTRPWFKPQWNEELFLAHDYLCSAVAIEADLARTVATRAGAHLPELMLTATSAAKGSIVHVPHIVVHVDSKAEKQTAAGRLDAVARHLRPLGANCVSGPFETVKVEWPLPDELPLVSIIIPTKDKLELLRPCVDSVLQRTAYANFEILIIDNGSVEKRTADYLIEIEENRKVRVLPYPGAYNFSAINNFAVREAHGSYLCLLNNDTEVLEPAWLTELMRYAIRPNIGAAGAKLLYDDGSIQHAGVVVGIGGAAGHAHRFLPRGQRGYFGMAHMAQFVSAVTAACLVVDRRKFMAVGGFDEESLAVAFNDVDLCLKLQKGGWRNVYVPHAVLVHHESKSRGQDSSPINVDRYRRELKILQDRWGTKAYVDPLHNPNLDRQSETFIFRV